MEIISGGDLLIFSKDFVVNLINDLELLSPAKDLECGIAAINCGADAVYIGAPKFGARSAAGNSIDDIEKLIRYAHKYNSRVYVTLNTILYENELNEARKLAVSLYNTGIDALIVQDMALLEMDLPPIPLFASTQTHNYSAERIKFLESVGIKRVILARELSLEQIKQIRACTNLELEFFVHGALCVSFSGQCYFSHAISGRSANRGECLQACRMKYSLEDSKGNVLLKDKYLLSLKDLNLSMHLEDLIDAGISSFKIEGRLKDISYVKNITSLYRRRLDEIIARRSSSRTNIANGNLNGEEKNELAATENKSALSKISSAEAQNEPAEEEKNLSATTKNVSVQKENKSSEAEKESSLSFKTFNRGYTTYFLNGRAENMASFNTPKAMGEYVGKGALGKGDKGKKDRGTGRWGDKGTWGHGDKEMGGKREEWFVLESEVKLHNGDGICFFDKNDELQGMNVNRVEGNKVFVWDLKGLFDGAEIYRNYDHEFNKNIKNENVVRQIPVKFYLSFPDGKVLLTARDLDGNRATELLDQSAEPAANQDKMMDVISNQLSKTGDTMFFTDEINITEKPVLFIPIGKLNELRRNVLLSLEEERIRNYSRWSSSVIKNDVPYPADFLDYRGNVVNKLSRAFYERHGVKKIENGFELGHDYDGKVIMTCRYCLKNEMGECVRTRGVGKRGLGEEGRRDKEMGGRGDGETWGLGDKGTRGLGDLGKGGAWYIRDKKRRYKLLFDCKNCEMSVIYLNEG